MMYRLVTLEFLGPRRKRREDADRLFGYDREQALVAFEKRVQMHRRQTPRKRPHSVRLEFHYQGQTAKIAEEVFAALPLAVR